MDLVISRGIHIEAHVGMLRRIFNVMECRLWGGLNVIIASVMITRLQCSASYLAKLASLHIYIYIYMIRFSRLIIELLLECKCYDAAEDMFYVAKDDMSYVAAEEMSAACCNKTYMSYAASNKLG